jgi:excisionase family DNA binding protein
MAPRKAVSVAPAQTPVLPVTPRLLSMKDAAKYLGCAYWAVRTLLWGKQIPYIQIGRRFVIDRTDLDKWVDKQKAAA